MTPTEAIRMLDRQLSAHGQSVTLKRGGVEHTVRGFVRSYKPEQLIGLITEADRQVVLSPTDLAGFMPRKADDFKSVGHLGTVMAAEPIHLNGVLVRVNLQVRVT